MSVRPYRIASVVSSWLGSDCTDTVRVEPARAVLIRVAALTLDSDYSESRHDVVLLTK